MKLTTNNRNARLGFTILELVIVLVILVAILAIVGPRLMRSQQKADIKLTQIQIANLETSLKEYAVDMKRYPVTEDGLAALFRQPTDENTSSRWSGPYLDGSELPVDAWGNAYIYRLDPGLDGLGRPIIVSKGPDSEINTDDDIFNYRPEGEQEFEENETVEGDSLDSLGNSDSFDLGDDFER